MTERPHNACWRRPWPPWRPLAFRVQRGRDKAGTSRAPAFPPPAAVGTTQVLGDQDVAQLRPDVVLCGQSPRVHGQGVAVIDADDAGQDVFICIQSRGMVSIRLSPVIAAAMLGFVGFDRRRDHNI